jgi:hypothetical protein
VTEEASANASSVPMYVTVHIPKEKQKMKGNTKNES